MDAPDGDSVGVVNIDDEGRVGILTGANPSYALDIGGPVQAAYYVGSGEFLTDLPNGYALDAPDGDPADALYVDNAGKVGIGTTSPDQALEVKGSSGAFIQVDGGNNTLSGFSLKEAGVARWILFFRGWQSDNLIVRDEAGIDTMVFEKGTGRVGIGRVPTANLLEVNGNASKSTAGSWLANSDVRIKQNIQPVTDALDKLSQVNLVSFEYTDDYRISHPGVEDRHYLNVVAQEFAEVFPEHVKGSGEALPDGSEILQVDTYPLTIYSAAAIQELARENAELRQRVDRLERLLEQKLGGGAL